MTQVLDLNFQGLPGVIACYVLPSSEGPILVDPGPTRTLGALRAGLSALGLDLADVRHVLLTHIHLDHAGAAGTIAAGSGATVYVHTRGASHLIRPGRLLASATQIYGEHMDALWGEMRPVPPEQVRALDGGEVLDLGGVKLEALYTPGHAVHHLAWQRGEELFCGDVAGIRLDVSQSPRAPTPPPDIDLEVWRETIASLRGREVSTLHLTHFGSYDAAGHWDALIDGMQRDAERVREGLAAGQDIEQITEQFSRAQEAELNGEGEGLWERMRFASPAWMSVQGLARYWNKRAAGSGRETSGGEP